jgi:hypothetical protein
MSLTSYRAAPSRDTFVGLSQDVLLGADGLTLTHVFKGQGCRLMIIVERYVFSVRPSAY